MGRNSDSELHNSDYEIKEQDRFLPIANVGRVMKKALPPHAKLSKESKECIQECVSEFISFITSQASDRGRLEKRKTLNGEDILWSMYILGFENYSETLKIYLAKYRQFEQMEAEKKATKSGRDKVSKHEDSLYNTGTDETSPSDAKSDCSPDSVNQVSEQDEDFNFPFEGDSLPPTGQWNSIDNYFDPKYMSNLNARRQSNVRHFNTESEILALEDFVEKME